jgi:mono/diheme cytochrome c family protein
MINRFAVTTLLVTSLGSVSVLAQDQNPAQRGRAVAERRCAACHAVQPDETVSPNSAAASFSRVASTSGMTELALQAMLHTSHRTMPNLILEADEARDVIAYILSLGRPR